MVDHPSLISNTVGVSGLEADLAEIQRFVSDFGAA